MPLFNRYLNPPAIPSSVSRDLTPAEYSWDTVVYQSGRPILDAELNLPQDAQDYNRVLLAGQSLPSGFIRGQGTLSSFSDYAFGAPPVVPANSFVLSRLLASVASMPVVIDYTAISTANTNIVTLPAASVGTGLPADIKRTDFVFLEVWRAQVAPSPRAYGTVEVIAPMAGDQITIDASGLPLPGPGPIAFIANTGFAIGINDTVTAANLAAAINASALSPNYVAANSHSSTIVTLTATFGGVDGNLIALTSSAGTLVISAPTLLLGGDRPNKPTQDTIYRHGNVGSPSGVDLTDNLVDPILNIESTQRVQVQYRLRVYSSALLGVNPKTSPDGFSNTAVLAQGTQVAPVPLYPFVPADNATVTSSSSATAYGFVDNGLYIAGDGSSAAATALGTADGFVYAIPVCFVFRRNNASGVGGFDPASNANGAISVSHVGFTNTHLDNTSAVAIAAGESDRPDGLFHDVIDASDILDLRRHVTPPGYDFASELKAQTQSLLDATNHTWQVDASDMGTIGSGSGGQATTPMVCDEIGRTPSGTRGDNIRVFDHIARRFASQPVVERVIFEVLPNAVSYPVGFSVVNSGTGWCEGDTIAIDFTALDPSSLQDWTTGGGAVTVAGNWPVGTRVTDVLTSYHDDGHSTVPVDQTVQFSSVTGVGTTTVTVTLDYNPQAVDVGGGTVLVDVNAGVNGSQRRVFLELEVTYPTGAGLTRTPIAPLTPSVTSGYPPYDGGAVVEFDATNRPGEMVPTWVPHPMFRPPFREVLLEQASGDSAIPANVVTDTLVTRTTTTVHTPRRIQTLTGLLANGVAPASATLGSSEREITLAAAVLGQVPVAVAYYAQDPIPDAGTGYELDVYYRMTAPQTCGVQVGAIPTNLLPQGLVLEPLSVSNQVWTAQTGAGSTELAFPYAAPLDPIPTCVDGSGLPKDWYFAATATVSVTDFSAETGSLTLHSMVPMDGSNTITLGSSLVGRGTLVDGEFRALYDYANHLGYKPTAMAQPLSGAARHKVFTTVLARSTQRTLLFRKGELLLIVIARSAELDSNNKVILADSAPSFSFTVASVYRTKNLLLTAGN